MSVIWKYLDKKSATASAIKDFSNMEFIIKHTNDEIKCTYDKMTLGSSRITGMPKAHNQNSIEERIVGGIEEIDVLKERYRQAKEYMDWFSPAWEQLSEEEQYILKEFYGDDENQSGSVFKICSRYNIERSSAYNKKNRALAKLATLLYGKC